MPYTSIKPVLYRLHRWIALVLTPVFLAILVSGAVLSFRPILTDVAPQQASENSVNAPALTALVQKLEAEGPLDAVGVSSDGQSLDVKSRVASVAGQWEIDSGARDEEAEDEPDIFQLALNLHRSLLLGLGLVIEIASWAMLAVMLIGPFLAWLRLRNTLRGWHMALGWLLLPVTILAPLTAVLMILHVGDSGAPPVERGRPISIARALAVSAPDVDLGHLAMARKFRGGSVMLQTSGEKGGRFVVTDKGATALTGGPGLVKQIHEGTWAGAWSGLLNLLVSLVLLGLTGTGFASWLLRQRRRRAGARQRASGFQLSPAGRAGLLQ